MLFAGAVLTAGLLALAGPRPAWAAELSFAPAQHFAAGSTPTTVTNADFDGDDKMDLAAQNFDTDNVSVLLGNGDGTFQDKTDFTVGDGPTAVISADFNSDELADLAVSNQNSNNVSVLLGNGDGTFRGKSDLAVGTAPTSVANGDFDGDGDADLAVSNSASNNVSVLLGNGDGTFGAAQPYSVSVGGINPNQIITDDFNGDGDVDLATAHVGHNTEIANFHGGVTVLLGNGDGTFQSASKVARIFLNYSVASADFDNDGDKDLAATSYGMTGGCCIFGEVSVRLGNGDGTFGSPRFYRVGSGHTGPSAVTSADFDSDGKADLAVSNSASDDVSVMLGNGDGTFAAAQNFTANDLPAFVISPDLDANGVADLAVANQASNNVSVLMNKAVDNSAPRVGSVSPADGATGVALNTNVDATFSETMDSSTITDQIFTLTKQDSLNPMPARVIYDEAKRKATLYPAINLEANTSYTATIEGGPDGVKDAGGNPLAADKVWTFSTVDTIAPAVPSITSPAEGSTFNVRFFTVSGTAEANSTIELFDESGSRGTAQANTSGQWSINLANVSDGAHSYTAKAKDAAGNASAESDPPRTVMVDATAPAAPIITSPANNSFDTDGSFTVSGTAEVGSIVGLFEVDATTGTRSATGTPTTAGTDGKWNIPLNGVAQGSHIYVAKATDAVGNTSADSNSRAVKVDATLPTVTGKSPKPNSTGISPTANVSATFSEAMMKNSLNRTTVKLVRAGTTRSVGASLSYPAPNRVVLNPTDSLVRGATYRVIIVGGTSGAKDLAGNALAANASWRFKVRA